MIFLYQKTLPHYAIAIFNRLNERLDDKLVVSYGQVNKGSFLSDPVEAITFAPQKSKNYWFFGEALLWRDFLAPFRLYGKPEIVILEQSPRILFLFPLYALCRLYKVPIIFWGQGGSMRRSVSSSKTVKDTIHRWMIRHADAYIVYGERGKQELSKLSSPSKIFVARNTIDTEHLGRLRLVLEDEGKLNVKERLNLRCSRYLCYVGRLYFDKRVDVLIRLYQEFVERRTDIGLIIIGDGPEREALENMLPDNGSQNENVVFTGDLSTWSESAPYLFSADLLVIPGVVGLAVNHAFSFGLPVVTFQRGSKGPYHGPEIEYIIDNKTGYAVDNGDEEAMLGAIEYVLGDNDAFRTRTIEFSQNEINIDGMVDGMIEAIQYLRAP